MAQYGNLGEVLSQLCPSEAGPPLQGTFDTAHTLGTVYVLDTGTTVLVRVVVSIDHVASAGVDVAAIRISARGHLCTALGARQGFARPPKIEYKGATQYAGEPAPPLLDHSRS